MPTTESRAVRLRPPPPAGSDVIAVVGPRNHVAGRLREALGPRFTIVRYDSSAPLLRAYYVASVRVPWRAVVFNFADQAKAATARSHRGRHKGVTRAATGRASLKALFAEWLDAIAELDRRVPECPIVVAADERRQAGLIQAALEAGADDWFTTEGAEHRTLLLHRILQILARFDERDDPSAEDTPGARRSGPNERPHRERRAAERGATAAVPDPATPASVGIAEGEHWEAPLAPDAATAAIARVREAAERLPTDAAQTARLTEVLAALVPHLRAASGRLDARRVAAALGLSLRQLAMALPVSPQALSETPDSPKAQPALHTLARIVAALRVILPDDAGRLAWLQTPNARWQHRAPRDAILAGQAEAIARTLEMIRDGGVGR